jgi:hypothetical protein
MTLLRRDWKSGDCGRRIRPKTFSRLSEAHKEQKRPVMERVQIALSIAEAIDYLRTEYRVSRFETRQHWF